MLLTLSLHIKQPLLVATSLSSTTNTIRARHQLGFLHGRGWQSLVACRVDNGSPRSEFEVDPEKAREALVELDQQLTALSEKQLRQPKIRESTDETIPRFRYFAESTDWWFSIPQSSASDPLPNLKFTRNGSMEEEGDEITADVGSPLGILVAVLFLFSIFYNIIFNAVIKPSFDMPSSPYSDYKSIDEVSAMAARGSSGTSVLQLLPVAPQIFNL